MKKIVNSIYLFIIASIILIPVITINTKENQISVVDNAYLPELPDFTVDREEGKSQLENYINKRIGLREQAIYVYQVIGAKAFHILESPLFMFGEDGHIMGKQDYYIRDFQHLNIEENEQLVEAYTNYLSKVNQYLSNEGIEFIYFLVPDKKTIYPECFPKDIYVYEGKSKTDMILEKLNHKKIPYIYPKEAFLAEKQNTQLYNKQYDVYHWNDLGNFYGNCIVDKYISERTNGLTPLRESDYELVYEHRDTAKETNYPIDENVPVYNLKDKEGIYNVTSEDKFLNEIITSSSKHYENKKLSNAPTILIFHDSYLGNSDIFYINRYREVIMVHACNYAKMKELVEEYDPDVVLFESVERVLRSNSEFWNIDSLNEWNAN